jgi:Ser/Thr protein kinase RdoA (MazF antagonist)
MSPPLPDLAAICAAFPLGDNYVHGAPHGSGHINATFAVTLERNGMPQRYILQRINRRIFHDVPRLMDNISRVSAHVAAKLSQHPAPQPPRQALTLVRTHRGENFHHAPNGECWRAYVFIEGASTHDVITSPQLAREAAYAFGEFQRQLADLPGPTLHETIPHFHDTPRRFHALERTIETDTHARAKSARAEIEFARQREALTTVLRALHARGDAPERVTHNDTKANNVMLDDATGRAVCVIDLDTVMPGLSLHDFGDLARSATNSAAEDDPDTGKVRAQLPIFEALVAGYLAATRDVLTPPEIAHLARAAELITFEIGVRFLTDYLAGDVYFRTTRPGHNLDRTRNQFALLASMEAQRGEMEAIVRRHSAS